MNSEPPNLTVRGSCKQAAHVTARAPGWLGTKSNSSVSHAPPPAEITEGPSKPTLYNTRSSRERPGLSWFTRPRFKEASSLETAGL